MAQYSREILFIITTQLFALSCSTFRNVDRVAPIENPFLDYAQNGQSGNHPVILRSKRGDRSFELELPGQNDSMADYVIPMNPYKNESRRGLASESSELPEVDVNKPTTSDREIVAKFSRGSTDDILAQRSIEDDLGLRPLEDNLAEQDMSYLAKMDQIKGYYRTGRHEAALIQVDQLLKIYPTDPKLFEMRGTLLDRLGHYDLALKSWKQALEFNPRQEGLRRFIERKDAIQARRPASQ